MQYTNMNGCLVTEKDRIRRKEMELRAKVFGLEKSQELPEKQVAMQEQPRNETPITLKN